MFQNGIDVTLSTSTMLELTPTIIFVSHIIIILVSHLLYFLVSHIIIILVSHLP